MRRPALVSSRGASVLVAAAVGLVASSPRHGAAEPYSVPILIDTDQDIWDLEANGDIDAEERDRLLALFEDPVDINTASRNALYELPNVTYSMVDGILRVRAERGRFRTIQELSQVPELPDEVYLQILPFVTVEEAKEVTPERPFSYGGRVKSGVADVASEDGGPTVFTQAELSLADWVTLGWIGFLEDMPGRLSYVPAPTPPDEQPYFVAEPVALHFDALRKLYAYTEQDIGKGMRLSAIGGSYVIGFGERLTLDTTQRNVRPYGWRADDILVSRPSEGDFYTRQGLFGGAVTLSQVGLGESISLDVTGFASWTQPNLYQYDFNLTELDDDGVRQFDSPTVYFDNGASAAGGVDGCYGEGRCHAYATFPKVYQELLAGGNATLFIGDRSQFGLTGFWANNEFVVGDDRVVFAPSARTPMRRSYFVLGADGAFGLGPVDTFAELSVMDNGGLAATTRTLIDFGDVFVEVTGRYYDEKYDNPKSRARAQPDEFLGSRARDEAGGKVLVNYAPFRWLSFQTYLDVWTRPTTGVVNAQAQFRGSWLIHKELRFSTWVNLRDKDLTAGGRDEDYDENVEYDFTNVDLLSGDDYSGLTFEGGGRGMLVNYYGMLSTGVIPLTRIQARFRLSWRDIGTEGFDDRFEKSYTASLLATVRPMRELTLSLRFRVSDEDYEDIARGEAFWEVYGQVRAAPVQWLALLARYDYRDFIDERPSSNPAPIHLVRATVEVRF